MPACWPGPDEEEEGRRVRGGERAGSKAGTGTGTRTRTMIYTHLAHVDARLAARRHVKPNRRVLLDVEPLLPRVALEPGGGLQRAPVLVQEALFGDGFADARLAGVAPGEPTAGLCDIVQRVAVEVFQNCGGAEAGGGGGKSRSVIVQGPECVPPGAGSAELDAHCAFRGRIRARTRRKWRHVGTGPCPIWQFRSATLRHDSAISGQSARTYLPQ